MLPIVKDIDPLAMQQLCYFMRHPAEVPKQFEQGVWIDWVFALKQPDGRRHLLEFVEGWSAVRITITASVPLVASVIAGTVWSVVTKDVSTAFTFASFLLAFGGAFFWRFWLS
jgi:hypothetical protein